MHFCQKRNLRLKLNQVPKLTQIKSHDILAFERLEVDTVRVWLPEVQPSGTGCDKQGCTELYVTADKGILLSLLALTSP